MPRGFGAVGLVLMWCLGAACSSGDYELERKGGPLPPDPDMSLGGSGGSSADGPIAFCDALTVIRNKCQRCHGDPLQNGAPVPFLTYDDLQQPYGDSELKWWEIAVGMVDRDVMPYVALNGTPGLVGGTVEPLTESEKATLLGWLKQGALPEGGTECP